MGELAALLQKLTSTLRRIAALEEQKTEVLIKGSVDELGALLNAQQPLIMQTGNLERQRIELLTSLGIGKEDMARIARYPAPGDETELAQAYLALKDAVKELRRLGDLNGRVLQARIDTKNHLLKILGAGIEPTTYAR